MPNIGARYNDQKGDGKKSMSKKEKKKVEAANVKHKSGGVWSKGGKKLGK
jgi:hypothetical protein